MKKFKLLLLSAFLTFFAMAAIAGNGKEMTFKVKPQALGIVTPYTCDYTVHLEFYNMFVMEPYSYPEQHYYRQHYRLWISDPTGNPISIPVNGAYINITCYNADGNSYPLTLNLYQGSTYHYPAHHEEGFPVPRSYSNYVWQKTRITHVIINTVSPSSYYGYTICPDVYYINAGPDNGTY